ncbi:LacI family DNA-binding transcriptional regulator [Serratia inhibens]|uniref:LacI family DNA-binding transcriptional regulator n=1 Tax=Serratia inhibens TaxID=2338073 RepID=A0AA93BXF9_9GAMM|nr:LacI family DNA-binding transcriptional regulator [Serratia inhibens]ANS42855.1 HTH-type transcriptional regulator DegA [Serratia inhibens PRI-2C]RJF57688.1 LacI family DNA-binding transcriptional regulator [Serratia inhibens]
MKFSIKQIAAQAGVSKATVDRALHQRGKVHQQTLRRIEQALQDLESQHHNSLASGRTLPIDVVMHTPERFSRLVTEALCSQLGSFAPFRIQLRFHIFEQANTDELLQVLERCRNQGSYGVILKVSDEQLLNDSVGLLQQQGIPVVTIVTDLPQSRRIGYIGMDNRAAGRTAAYLLARWLPQQPQCVAVVIGSQGFRGEEERESGFRQWLRERAAHLSVVDISGGMGVHAPTLQRVTETLLRYPDIHAVYSVGGGNSAIVEAFSRQQRRLAVFIGHDLDHENRQLLAQERIDAVIDHDLQRDARSAFQTILQYHGFLPGSIVTHEFSRVSVVTPFNLAMVDEPSVNG